jgi:phospholipid/cholesterol/gamma-HCH transport system substrate-binding protein
MLSDRAKNTIVGLTMLIALAGVMYGIFLLGRFPFLRGISTYTITVVAEQANGVAPGNKVDLSGVEVGTVQSVDLQRDPKTGAVAVRIILAISGGQPIPANVHAFLGRQTIGTAYVSLFADKPSTNSLPTDNSAIIPGQTADTGLIPKEVFSDLTSLKNDLASLSDEIKKVTGDLHTLLVYHTPEDVARANPDDPNRPRDNIATLVVRLNRTTQSLNDVVGDPKLQANVRLILQNIAEASAQLRDTLKNVNTTAANADHTLADIGDTARKFGATATQASSSISSTEKQVIRVSDQLVDTLAAIEKTTNALSKGEGTTGKLINDPRLYDSLVDLSKSLKSTVDDLHLLVEKWKEEGLNLRLK